MNFIAFIFFIRLFKIVSTTACELKNFDYIFHAIAPNFDKYNDIQKFYKKLELAYMSIFFKCETFKKSSVALPCLSTGMSKLVNLIRYTRQYIY